MTPGLAGRPPERRMPGEWQFPARREDPHPVVRPLVARGQQEGRLRQVRPPGEQPHLVVAQPVGPVHDGDRVAQAGLIGEDIDLPEVSHHGAERNRMTRSAAFPKWLLIG
jgi:hypothetical protein